MGGLDYRFDANEKGQLSAIIAGSDQPICTTGVGSKAEIGGPPLSQTLVCEIRPSSRSGLAAIAVGDPLNRVNPPCLMDGDRIDLDPG